MATSRTTISCATAMTASARPRLRGRGVTLPCATRVPEALIAMGFSSLRGWCGAGEPKAKVFVDAEKTELQALIARKGGRRCREIDDLGLDQGVVGPAIGDDTPAGGQHV